MKTIFLSGMALVLLLFVNNVIANNNEQESKPVAKFDIAQSIKEHASYFGFTNTKSYLHFAHQLERLVSGDASIGSPLNEDPRYLSTIGARRAANELSDTEKRQLSEMMNERKNALAAYLGVPAKDVYRLMDAYLDYTKLQRNVFSAHYMASAAPKDEKDQ